MVESCSISRSIFSISRWYINNDKQLEYITKDHIATHTILNKLKTALFFSFLVA